MEHVTVQPSMLSYRARIRMQLITLLSNFDSTYIRSSGFRSNYYMDPEKSTDRQPKPHESAASDTGWEYGGVPPISAMGEGRSESSSVRQFIMRAPSRSSRGHMGAVTRDFVAHGATARPTTVAVAGARRSLAARPDVRARWDETRPATRGACCS